jgi:hypothetical protein
VYAELVAEYKYCTLGFNLNVTGHRLSIQSELRTLSQVTGAGAETSE